MRVISVILLGIICAMSLSAEAATYWVSKSGSDSNGCNNSASPLTTTAKLTITAGINCLNAGDMLRIRGGTYSEFMNWQGPDGGSSGNPMTIEANPGEVVIWAIPSGQSTALNLANIHYVTFRGIIWDGANGSNALVANGYTTTAVSGGQQLISMGCSNPADDTTCPHNLLFENNELRFTAYVAVSHGGHTSEWRKNYIHHIGKVSNSSGFYVGRHNVIFDGNVFDTMSGDAVAFWNQTDAIVHNGVFRNNRVRRAGWFWASEGTYEGQSQPILANTPNARSPGVWVSRGSGTTVYNNTFIETPGAIYLGHNASNCTAYHNTIYGNTASGIGATDFNSGITLSNLGGGSTNCTVRNNIVYQPGVTSPPPLANLGSGHSISNNLCSDTSAGNCPLTGNPGFVSAAGGDLHIAAAGSPAVNAGLTLGSPYNVDIEGLTRPSGQYTIGAYQFAVGGVSNPDDVVLQAWYRCDGTVSDITGNGHTGTLLNGATATGAAIIGTNSCSFDGVNDGMQVTDVTGLQDIDSFSISAWVRPTTTDTFVGTVLQLGDSYGLTIQPSGNVTCFFYNGASYPSATATGVNVLNGTNHHLACTYDRNTSGPGIRVYVDDVQVGFTSVADAISYTGGDNLWIGRHAGGGAGYFYTGLIDQVRIYTGMLTATDISNLFNEQVTQPGVSMPNMVWTTANAVEGQSQCPGTTINCDLSHELAIPIGFRGEIRRTGGQLVEFFPPYCRRFSLGVWTAWTAVGNSYGSLGVRFLADSVKSMGQQVLQTMLPTGGLTNVNGVFIANPVNTTFRTILDTNQRTEWETRLEFGAPASSGDLIQCRYHRESGAAFDSYGPAAPPDTFATLTVLGPVAGALRLGVRLSGGSHQ